MKCGRFVPLALSLLLSLVLLSCGKQDEALKIVIEEKAPPATVPAESGPSEEVDRTPSAEPPGPEMKPETPPAVSESEERPGAVPMLKTPVASVIELVEKGPEVVKLMKGVPVWLIAVGKPANALWTVRLSFKGTALLDITVDDNTPTVLSKKPYLFNIKKTREGLEDKTGSTYKRAMERRIVSYSEGVRGALAAGGVRAVDYTKEMKVSVGVNPFDENPKGEVVIDYGDGGSTAHVTFDGLTGRVLEVSEE